MRRRPKCWSAVSPAEVVDAGIQTRIRRGPAPTSRPPFPLPMNHREYPLTPSQPGVNGALDIFVEGHRKHDIRQMLIGLSVLRSATEAQVLAAMPFVQASQHVSRAEIEAMLAA